MGSRLFRSPEPLLILVPGIMSRPPVTGHARFYQLILFFSVSLPANNISAFANNLQDVHAICNTLDPCACCVFPHALTGGAFILFIVWRVGGGHEIISPSQLL